MLGERRELSMFMLLSVPPDPVHQHPVVQERGWLSPSHPGAQPGNGILLDAGVLASCLACSWLSECRAAQQLSKPCREPRCRPS